MNQRFMRLREVHLFPYLAISDMVNMFMNVCARVCEGLPWWLRWLRIYLQFRRPGFDPWVRKIPWRREWQPTLVLLPGESHGQRSLLGYSPWGCKRVRQDWSDLARACVDVRWDQNLLNFKGILDQIFFSLQVEYYDLWTQIAAKSFSTSRTSRGVWRILCKTLTLYLFIIWKQSWVSWTIKKNMYKIW